MRSWVPLTSCVPFDPEDERWMYAGGGKFRMARRFDEGVDHGCGHSS